MKIFLMMKINKENSEKNSDEDTEFDSDDNDDSNDVSDLSILEKEESLKPAIVENLKKFSKNFKRYKKLREGYLESKILNKKTDPKILTKIKNSEENLSSLIRGLFINQARIDDVVEKHKKFNLQNHFYFKQV